MRYQAVAAGVFILLFGLSIFLYWLSLPDDQKNKELFGTKYIVSSSKPTENVEALLSITNVELYNYETRHVISYESPVGYYVETDYVYIGDISLYTSFLRGFRYFTTRMQYDDIRYDGIAISGIFSCDNCIYSIYVNGEEVYRGNKNGLNTITVTNEHILSKNTTIKVELHPSRNILRYSQLNITGFRVYYLKKSYIEYSFYYINGSRVFLDYDFCPSDKESVKFIINNIYIITPPACSSSVFNNLLEITRYLSSGWNTIKIEPIVPINLTATLLVNSPRLYFTFPYPKQGIINIVYEGSGIIYVNNNRIYLNDSSTQINIKEYLKPRNLVVIEPLDRMYIYYLEIL